MTITEDRVKTYDDLWKIVRNVLRDIRFHKLINQIYLITVLDKLTLNLEKAWRNAKKQEYNDFVASHMTELFQIRQLLVGKSVRDNFKQEYHASLKLCNNRIFANTFHIHKTNVFFSGLPAKVFSQFIRGITFFQSDVGSHLEYPPYHRPASCGTAELDFREKFTINAQMSKTVVNQRKNALRSCYIERMIFDTIYRFMLGKQESRHLVELRNIERFYQDYFPGHDLTVDVNMALDTIHPSFLVIIDTYDDGKFHIEESYFKENPENPDTEVKCTRITYRNFVRKMSPFLMKREAKIQSFLAEVPWSPSAPRLTSSV